jgi:hypothetical protein
MESERERQIVARKLRTTRTQMKKVSRGSAKMKAAADKTLEKHSEQIAFSLLSGTLRGNVTSARLLIALAEGQTDSGDEKSQQGNCSLAEKLASEPEWIGEASEAATRHSV